MSDLCSIEEAIVEIQQGRMLIVVDDEKRGKEGDLVMAAEFVQADDVNFMASRKGVNLRFCYRTIN